MKHKGVALGVLEAFSRSCFPKPTSLTAYIQSWLICPLRQGTHYSEQLLPSVDSSISVLCCMACFLEIIPS